MKKCPFCAEEVQDDAKICRFCNRDITPRRIFRPGLIILILVVGGFIAVCVFLSKIANSRDTHVFNPSQHAEQDPVSAVKSAALEFDQSTTIGKAFDHYRYFDNVEWRQLKTENDRTLVQVAGTIRLDKLSDAEINEGAESYWKNKIDHNVIHEQASILKSLDVTELKHVIAVQIVVEFLLNVDNSFGVHAASFRFVLSNDPAPGQFIDQSSTDNLTLLRSIYENQLPPRVANAISLVNGILENQKSVGP